MPSLERMSLRQQSPSSRAVSELTREYQLTVLRLAHEFSGSDIAWNVSQHVLDQLWENEVSSPTSSAPSNNSSSTAVIAHGCQACGHQLHPGWKGTTLRVKRPNKVSSISSKKTLRRRELRKRKKAARAEAMKSKKSGRRFNDKGKSTAEGGTLCLLRDDPAIGPLDHNRLVLTCGRCGDKTLCKGLKRETQVQPKIMHSNPPRKPRASFSSKFAALDEFERLPKISKKPPPQLSRGKTATQKLSSSKMTPLEQKLALSKKKKRKPKPSQSKKGGNLMNFLSSLNDH